jgi:hypothetical protein
MPFERQKMIQKELERIPRGVKGSPQNDVRHIVNAQRLFGRTFDESVEIAVNFVRERHPGFSPQILPPLQ